MENRKIITTFYLFCAFVVLLLSRSTLQYFYTLSYQFRKFAGIQVLKEAIPLVLAAAVFLILFKNKKSNAALDEVVVELKKVSWPNREDVKKSTILVIAYILICSAILAVFDFIWGKAMSVLLYS